MQISQIGQFQVHKLIAVGGQAKIYHAKKDSIDFAIKVYNLSCTASNNQFLEEIQLIQLLEHKSILTPLQYRLGESVFLRNQEIQKKNIVIMEYKQNGDLMNQIQKNGKLDPKLVLKLARYVLDCLVYLSEKGVYHCDLKLQNILLDQFFRPLLIDFGLLTRKKDIMPKNYPQQYYMAPQVKKGMPYNQKSEAFSFGVLVFILSAGCLPFRFTKHTDVNYRHLLQGKPNLFWKVFEQQNIYLNQNLKNAIINLLEPNPKRRWSFSDVMKSEWMSEDPLPDQQYFRLFSEQHDIDIKQQSKFQIQLTDNEQRSRQIEA